MRDKLERDDIVGFLGDSVEFDGKISFTGVLRVDGKLKGKIRSKNSLVVGETGQIEGDINVSQVSISGKVTGSIKAQEKLELSSSAKVFADVTTSCLKIEEGAVFQGNCTMEDKKLSEQYTKKPLDFPSLVKKDK
jgi:cytoskeletal protein CcmA (bactofilin family)